MMAVLEKVPAEVRSKAWILPITATTALSHFLPGDGETIARSEQLWLGGLGVAGIAIGLLWNWISPRELAPRLAFAAGGFVLVVIFTLLPIAGDFRQDNRQLYLGLGVVSGLVVSNWWKWLHTADDQGRSAGA